MGLTINLDREHSTSHSSSMSVGLLDPKTTGLDDSIGEPAEGPSYLFEEARRRRKRILLTAAIVCVVFALGVTFLTAG